MANKNDSNNQVASSYLGSLRSELDDEASIDSSFTALETAFGLVRSAFVSKKLTAHSAAQLFQKLTILSADGGEWTLGSSTATWYRRDRGGKWSSSTPPIGITVDSNNLNNWVFEGIDSDLNHAVQASKSVMEVEDKPSDAIVASTFVINSEDVKSKKENKSGTYSYTIFASSEKNEDMSWIDEEWELSGESVIGTVANHSPLPESVLPPVSSVVDDSAEVDLDDSGHYSPEDFFLKDE